MTLYRYLRFGVLAIALGIFVLTAAPQTQGQDKWRRVRSKNFTLVGNASEKDVRNVANRLEQFRAVFGSLFPAISLNSQALTTVVVFKSDNAFKLFKANPNDAGYFQSGEDVNYIALTSERTTEAQPFRVIFHEYVHLLVNNTMGETVPLWFNEGLAEYYSTFDIKDNARRVMLGEPIESHVLYLRRNELLPLRALFAVDHNSPYYNEGNKMNIFYAESWMFMHYLLQGDSQKHRPQLSRLVDLLRQGVKVDDAFPQAFEKNIESVENDFKGYIHDLKYTATEITFGHKLDLDADLQATPLTDAEAHAYLGDLLFHTQRLANAEGELQQAITLDPNSPMALATYGMMRVGQGRMEDARPYLEKAIAVNPQNHLTHYYYAFALSDLRTNEYRLVSSYSDDLAVSMRKELEKAIALKPDHAKSYSLLGFVNLVRNEQIDETIELLQKGLNISPANDRLLYTLAQLYTRKERFAEARQLLKPVIENSPDPETRQQAARLANAVQRAEEELARIKEQLKKDAIVGLSSPDQRGPAMGSNSGATLDDTNATLALRELRPGESRVQGMLTSIDCDDAGITFRVRTGDRLLKFHRDSFQGMYFTAFTAGLGREITCGPRQPENLIVLTYAIKPATNHDGEVRAIEFVPQSFVLKP